MSPTIQPHEFQLWARFIKELSGLMVGEDKQYLVQERIGPILNSRCSSFSELYFQAKMPGNQELRNRIIDAITTKETSFFRDDFLFEHLKTQVFPEYIQRIMERPLEKRIFRIWSAGCSAGQELYSIAMTLSELDIQAKPIRLELFGTDIALSAIFKAINGVYSQFEIERGLSPERRDRFFQHSPSGWKISEELKSLVRFRQMNLLEFFEYPETMDFIFVRNVLIYFDSIAKQEVLTRMARVLGPEGFLFLGATENLQQMPGILEEKRKAGGRLVCYSQPRSVSRG